MRASDIEELRATIEQVKEKSLSNDPAGEYNRQLVKWLEELVQIREEIKHGAATKALDEIAILCGCPEWDYPGQVVRDVEIVIKKAKEEG